MDVQDIFHILESFKTEEDEEMSPQMLSLLEILFSTESVAEALKKLGEIPDPIQLLDHFAQSINSQLVDGKFEYLRSVVKAVSDCPPSSCLETYLL